MCRLAWPAVKTRRQAAALLALAVAAALHTAAGGTVAPGKIRFRIAVSASTVEGINDNDARAAMKIWGDTVAEGMGLDGIYDASILSQPEEVLQAARGGKVDALVITSAEYPRLAAYVDHGLVIADESLINEGDEYLLLVHQQSGIRDLGDLRGRALILQRGVRMCLARPWLETLLARAGLGGAGECFARITQEFKPPMAVLPVFFHRADAALISRRAFAAMAEMNPQLGKQLRVLAASPKLIDTVILFRKDAAPDLKERLKNMMLGVHQTVAGQQILTLFQSRRLAATDTSVLRGALEMIADYERLPGRNGPPR
jgi:ABC-type phosphate/phosphonate transport system substrate-binding protein